MNYPYLPSAPKSPIFRNKLALFLLALIILLTIFACIRKVKAEEIIMTASWYSVASLKKEGTWKYSKGRMANGKEFRDENFTCATRAFPLGAWLRVVNLGNSKEVRVKVTDRISERFAETRIDLSKVAFSKLDKLEKGLIPVKVEYINE